MRQSSLAQQLDSAQAPFIRAGDGGEFLVGFFGSAIQRNLDAEGRPLRQIVRNFLSDEGAIGEESNQKTLLLGVGVNLQEVLAGEDFAAGVKKPEAAHLDQLVEHPEVLFRAHFAFAGVLVAHGQVVVAVLAFQRTTPRHLNRNLERRPLAKVALVQVFAECSVGCLIHDLRESSSL